MRFSFWKQNQSDTLPTSQLLDEVEFYSMFTRDLLIAKSEVIIESPFLTTRRINTLLPLFEQLVRKGVQIHIVTRKPEEHDDVMRFQAEIEVQNLYNIGVDIIFCDNYHHRKLAIIDKTILYEGSLNILSQNTSSEIMRRTESAYEAQRMFSFLKLDSII